MCKENEKSAEFWNFSVPTSAVEENVQKYTKQLAPSLEETKFQLTISKDQHTQLRNIDSNGRCYYKNTTPLALIALSSQVFILKI